MILSDWEQFEFRHLGFKGVSLRKRSAFSPLQKDRSTKRNKLPHIRAMNECLKKRTWNEGETYNRSAFANRKRLEKKQAF